MDSIFAAEVVWYGKESDCMRQPEKQRNTQVDARHAPRAQPRIGKAPRDITSPPSFLHLSLHFLVISAPSAWKCGAMFPPDKAHYFRDQP
jgi:hypothetical protein